MFAKRSKSYEMDMCSGPLLPKILIFSLPLMLTGILQLLYNAADIVVVGRYAGSVALAAVGSTGSLINLIINLFMGLSVGASVIVAQHYGANSPKDVSEAVHTSITIAGISGVAVGLFGIAAARPLLHLMGSPDDVLDHAALYMRIYFVGMPAFMLYNFGAGVLRAIGDTRRPLYFLTLSGLVNVCFNLIFVIVFGMGVDGVAWATVISQYLSAALILYCLIRSEGAIHLDRKKLSIRKDKLLGIIRVGLPAGLQGSLFSISNVLIQSGINSFGSIAMAGNAAASNIEGFVYTSMNTIHQAAVTFTSQNMGARRYERISRITWLCAAIVTIVGLAIGWLAYLFAPQLLRIYSSDPEVIRMGILRMEIICTTYFTCGLMDMLVGVLRGMGYSVVPMIVSLAGACGLRILWIYTVFAWHHDLTTLYLSYPISWVITAAMHLITYIYVKKKLDRQIREGTLQAAG